MLSAALEKSLDAVAAPRADFAGLTLDRPRLMGVVNVTPDSFSDGGRYAIGAAAIAHGRALMAAGADILDIGGESTRPGAAPVSIGEETRSRVAAGDRGAGEGWRARLHRYPPCRGHAGGASMRAPASSTT